MTKEYVRVLRLIEYSGTREEVEKQILKSMKPGTHCPGSVQISICQLGEFADVFSPTADRILLDDVRERYKELLSKNIQLLREKSLDSSSVSLNGSGRFA